MSPTSSDNHSNSPARTARAAPMVRGSDGKLVKLQPGRTVQMSSDKRLVDVCFVFDTTGSMSNKIEGLVHSLVDFVRELAQMSLDWRLSVVPFGDLTVPGDRIVNDNPFVTGVVQAERMLRTMPRFSGGRNDGESSLEAVQAAMAKAYRPKSVKVLVVLTDEPPLETSLLTAGQVRTAMVGEEFVCFVASPDLNRFRSWADRSGGKWYPIDSVDMAGMTAFFRGLMHDVARAAKAVYEIGGGSVESYRAQLGSKERRQLGGQ